MGERQHIPVFINTEYLSNVIVVKPYAVRKTKIWRYAVRMLKI